MNVLLLTHLVVMWVEAACCLLWLGSKISRLKPWGQEGERPLTLSELSSGWLLGYIVSEPILFGRDLVAESTEAWKWLSLAASGSLAAIGVVASLLAFSLLHRGHGGNREMGVWWIKQYVYVACVVSAIAVGAGWGFDIDKSVGVGQGVYSIGRFGLAFFFVGKAVSDYRDGTMSRPVNAAAMGSVLFFLSVIFSFLPLGWAMLPAIAWAVKRKDGDALLMAQAATEIEGAGRR